jgi:hypothetical protein
MMTSETNTLEWRHKGTTSTNYPAVPGFPYLQHRPIPTNVADARLFDMKKLKRVSRAPVTAAWASVSLV